MAIPSRWAGVLVSASFALGGGVGSPCGAAGQATLVADLAQDAWSRDSAPSHLRAIGSRIVFAALDPVVGNELRATSRDGLGIELLVDANPGTASSQIELVGDLGSVLVYAAGPPEEQLLWVTDGTPAGTRKVVDQSGATVARRRYGGLEPVRFGARLAVLARGASSGEEGVWILDATGSAVRLHGALRGNSESFWGLAATRDALFFQERGPIGSPPVIWTSDGSAEGTVPLGGDPSPGGFGGFSSQQHYFFVVQPGPFSKTLCAVGASSAEAVPLVDFAASTSLEFYASGADSPRLYFLERRIGDVGRIWVSDGTPEGTRPIVEIPWSVSLGMYLRGAWIGEKFVFWAGDLWVHGGGPGAPERLPAPSATEEPAPPLELDGAALLVTRTGAASGEEIWRTDGTPAGTVRLRRLCPPACGAWRAEAGEVLEDVAFLPLTLYNAFWDIRQMAVLSDGSEAGTQFLLDGETGLPWEGPQFLNWKARSEEGILVSWADFAGVGRELFDWRLSDGVMRLVENLAPETGPSDPRQLRALGGGLYWAGTGPSSDRQGWFHTPGSAAPAALPDELCDRGALQAIADLDGRRVFMREDHGGYSCMAALELATGSWVKLAPVEGQSSFNADPPFLVSAGRLYFGASVSGIGWQLWASDGTVAGTGPLARDGLPNEGELVAATSSHLFLRSRYLPWQLWALPIAGGEVGWIAALELPWGEASGTEVAVAGQRLFFSRRETDGGETLWSTDGSSDGTQQVWRSPESRSRVLDLFPMGATVYFLVGSDRMTLWRSGGTVESTWEVAELGSLAVAASDVLPRFSAVLGGRLFFTAETDEMGSELWATGGTASSTVGFDLVAGADSSAPRWLVVAAGQLFFAAEDAVFGREVWMSDGTLAGTLRWTDIAAGGASSAPEELVAVGSTVYFAADDGARGRELWSIHGGGVSGCVPTERRLCLGGGRFAVEATWRDFGWQLGAGRAIPWSGDAGGFWFFHPDNLELLVKVHDGRPLNGHYWFYAGALSNVAYDLLVTDTTTRTSRRYVNRSGEFNSFGDVDAFAAAAALPAHFGALRLPPTAPSPPGTESGGGLCAPAAARLCLGGGRFAVEVRWRDFAGNAGTGRAIPWTADTGGFWFFDAAAPELLVKVLDGSGVNGRHWVFSGGLSNVEYTLTVTDLASGAVREYVNSAGTYASFGDVNAF